MDHFEANASGLILAARQGDETALDRLLNHYRNYLKLLAQTQLDQRLRTRVSPSDLVQETLIDAFRDFNKFRGRKTGELAAWLRTILSRRLADQLRHHNAGKRDFRREQALEEAIHQSSVTIQRSLLSSDPSVATKVDEAERAISLANAIDRLPPDYRSVIMLREVEHLSFDEVAKRLQRSSGAVRMLWVRALERLRKELEVAS